MSFLDNLENDLKALESRDQGGIEDTGRRDAERLRSKAAAPWADRLKRSAWTQALMQQATRAGFQRRTKINLLWIDSALRLEGRECRLELRPGPTGVTASFQSGREEKGQLLLDLEGDPAPLVAQFMGLIEERIRQDALAAERAAKEVSLDLE